MEILIENSSNDGEMYFGRTIYQQAVVVKSEKPLNAGTFVEVEIEDGNLRTLKGVVK